jgi:hypothetical protein
LWLGDGGGGALRAQAFMLPLSSKIRPRSENYTLSAYHHRGLYERTWVSGVMYEGGSARYASGAEHDSFHFLEGPRTFGYCLTPDKIVAENWVSDAYKSLCGFLTQ